MPQLFPGTHRLARFGWSGQGEEDRPALRSFRPHKTPAFDLRKGRIYKRYSGLMGRDEVRGRCGNGPDGVFALPENLCNGMLGKAVKIRHCPATVSACCCVR
jgi:hypothetical protein